jgi:hypothetical protein
MYRESKLKWNQMEEGEGKTVQDMYFAVTGNASINMSAKDRSGISSFMSNAISRGWAKKESNTRPAVYIKVKAVPSRGGPRLKKTTTPKDDNLNEVQVGNAILAVIEKLTQKNKELKDVIKLLNAEIVDAVKAKMEVEEMLRKTKERILELNQTSGKGRKTVNLHELQNLTRQ